MGIKVDGVGHVVLKVSEMDRALEFYVGGLGLNEVARGDFGAGLMVFLSTGHNHHDVALVEVGADARRPAATDIGLYHVALKIGDDLETLRAAKDHLESRGVRIQWVADHAVSQSIYIADPDGNNVELFVDADHEIWRAEPSIVATAVALDIDDALAKR
jgi:catechol 2,3-dioxygenase